MQKANKNNKSQVMDRVINNMQLNLRGSNVNVITFIPY